jgi:hypothetical protein
MAHETVHLPTEYSHYEGALARTIGLPLLVLAEERLMRRVVFDSSFGPYIGEVPRDANRSWLQTKDFDVPFGYWRTQLERRRDVFLDIAAPYRIGRRAVDVSRGRRRCHRPRLATRFQAGALDPGGD